MATGKEVANPYKDPCKSQYMMLETVVRKVFMIRISHNRIHTK